MLDDDRSSLDYRTLSRRARNLARGNGIPLKIALLAEVSTQHLVPLLKVLFSDRGFEAEIYEAGFDTVELEAYDAESQLYHFRPQLVIVIRSPAKFKAAYYQSTERSGFPAAFAEQQEAVWTALQDRMPVPLIQNTFPLPYERQFGNFDLKVPGSLVSAAREANRELAIRARARPSVLLCDLDYIASWIGRKNFFDEKLWALSKSLCALDVLPEVARQVVDIAAAAQGRAVKCVVVDCDNTLWGGIVGDDGLEALGLGDLDDGGAFRSFQLYLRELGRRGILLAVCSKNDDATARRVFHEHPDMVLKEEDFAAFVANWDDKAENIRRIAATLNLGLDSFVFLDDNPFERNLVRQILPEVIVPELPADPANYVRAISELNLFEAASHSALDAQRVALYREQALRETERTRHGDVESYLRSLETAASVRAFEPQSLSRIAQLIQRSNQFNLTTRRLSEAECAALMTDAGRFHTFTVTVRDRVGDFGLVCLAVLRREPPDLHIDVFLMSCRVLQRGVEQLAMNRIFECAAAGGFTRVVGRYVPTAKNAMVRDFYARFGFTAGADGNGAGTEWHMPVAAYQPQRHFIREQTSP